MQKLGFGPKEPDFGRDGQNSDNKSQISDSKSQNPDNYTLHKPPENPPEVSALNTLKNSGEAGPLHEHVISCDLFDAPIVCHETIKEYAFFGKLALIQGRISNFINEEIIAQGDDQTLDEFITALNSKYDDAVTLHELPEASIENESGTGVVSAYDWDHVLHECERHGVLFDGGSVEGRDRSVWFHILLKEFIKTQGSEVIRSLVEAHDADVTLKTLGTPFLHFHRQNKERLQKAGLDQAPAKMGSFYAGLELLASAFQNAQDLVPADQLKSGLGRDAVESVCDAILERMATTERTRYEALYNLALGSYADYRRAFVWGRDNKSSDPSLSAHDKAKLFMKGVTQIRKAGVPVTVAAVDTIGNVVAVCVTHMKKIHSNGDDVYRVKALFEERPWISSDLLSRGFRTYLHTHVLGLKKGESFRKSRFFCTKIASVSWFLANLDNIVKELKGDHGDLFNRISAPP